MVRPALAVLAVSIAVAPLAAQDFTGTYRLNAGGGTTITLTLQQSRTGQITGTLQGNTSFQVQAQVGANGQFAGYAANQAGRLYLEGVLAGTQLQLAMAEVGADGQPQVATARTVTMDRVAVMGQAAPAAPQGGLLLGRRNAPPAQAAPGGQVAPGSGSPQDQQITQLLVRSAWCSFSYNQTTGTTNTERVVYQPDGTGYISSGAETYNSGRSGTVAGQHQGGTPFRWRLQNGVLLATTDGFQWGQFPLQITANSNGYPIVKADGKEYTMCN